MLLGPVIHARSMITMLAREFESLRRIKLLATDGTL
jgi:hypothetical protein